MLPEVKKMDIKFILATKNNTWRSLNAAHRMLDNVSTGVLRSVCNELLLRTESDPANQFAAQIMGVLYSRGENIDTIERKIQQTA